MTRNLFLAAVAVAALAVPAGAKRIARPFTPVEKFARSEIVVAGKVSAIEKEILGLVEKDLRVAYAIGKKQDRHAAIEAAKEKVSEHFFPAGAENPNYTPQQVAGLLSSNANFK